MSEQISDVQNNFSGFRLRNPEMSKAEGKYTDIVLSVNVSLERLIIVNIYMP